MTTTKKTLLCTYRYLRSVNHTAAEAHAPSEVAAVKNKAVAAIDKDAAVIDEGEAEKNSTTTDQEEEKE
jgi:hypothetical protein